MISILNTELELKQWSFPAGERGCSVSGEIDSKDEIYLQCNFTGSDDIIDLLLVKDALSNAYKNSISLKIPYFPYARQDRRVNSGESHSLKVVAGIINSCEFSSVEVLDAHSDVLEAVLENVKIISQESLALSMLDMSEIDLLLAPDAGAAKKIYKLAKLIGKPVIIANKERDLTTGKVIRSVISEHDRFQLQGKNVWIVDDICDGGASFIELAKVLHGHNSLNLYVTHGIFSKGKDVFKKDFAQVLCYNDMSKFSK